MDLAVIIFLSFSSFCTILVALCSIYQVFVERDRKRFYYKIAFPFRGAAFPALISSSEANHLKLKLWFALKCAQYLPPESSSEPIVRL